MALPPTMTNVTSGAPDFAAASALYVFDTEVEAGKGEPFMIVYKGVPYPVNAAQGRELRWFENGANDEVYIALANGHFAKFTKSSDAPSDYTTSAYSVASFLANRQETYFGEKAVDLSSDEDDDYDGVPNIRETGRGMNPYSNDSDGDYVLDGVEQRWSTDTDLDGLINALDKDSDNDGVPDGTEDINRDGVRQANETNVLRQDTDYDALQDGLELGYTTGTSDTCMSSGQSGCSSAWLMTPDVQGWTVTSPLDVDFDDDGIRDGVEDSDHNGRYDNGSETNATNPDTDGDLLWDGIETGVMVPTEGTNLSLWHRDGSPFENTDPRSPDTDGDHLMDSVEDWNLDGLQTWGTNETDPTLYDSDGDGLCDGNCSGKGEDLNLNGWRDQDEEGNWTETDALANDSDVDGLWDGWEVNGSWCYSTQSGCTPGYGTYSARILDPLNPDTDGDGLRDGQETAGWKVLLWREITMESMHNYTVTSDPRQANNDGDANSDFVEFQNGSDPWATDTDGDGMNDSFESSQGLNVTGFYMQAPKFMPFVDLDVPIIGRIKDDGVLISKECRGGALSTFGCTPFAKVAFNVSSYWGVGWWEVRYGKPRVNATEEVEIKNITGYEPWESVLKCGLFRDEKAISNENCDKMREIIDHADIAGQTKGDHAAGAKNFTMYVEFQMTTAEDHWDGPFIQVDVFDIYGAGVQKTVKLKSTLDKVMDVLSAIAKAIAEAISALCAWIMEAVKSLIIGFLRTFEPAFHHMARPLIDWFKSAIRESEWANRAAPGSWFSDETAAAWLRGVIAVIVTIVFVMQAVSILIRIVMAFASFGTSEVANTMVGLAITMLVAVAMALALGTILGWVATLFTPGGQGAPVIDWVASKLPGGEFDAK